MEPTTTGTQAGLAQPRATAANPTIHAGRPVGRRAVLKAGAALGAAAAGARLSPRRSMARQGLTGEVNLRYFPFGAGVEDLYAAFAAEFEAANPGVRVQLDFQPWDNRYPKMLADLAAGTGPDVMFITTDVLIRFSEAEAIVPLDGVLPPEVWEGYEPAAVEEVSLGGNRWYVPMDREVPIWMANRAILREAGLDPEQPPATWEDLLGAGEAVKDATDGAAYGWGYNAASPTLNTTFYPFLYQAGGRPISEDGRQPTFNSPAGVEALTYIVELFEREISPMEYLQPIESGQDPFTQGYQAVSIQNFVSGLLTLRQAAPDIDASLTPVIRHKEAWGFGGMRSWAMSSSARTPEAAAAFLAFLTRPEIMTRHAEAFGVFPVKTAALGSVYQDDPEIAGLRDRFPNIFGEQKHKYGRDLMPLVVPEIQGAILGEKSPQQALDDAASQVMDLFAQG
jgi:multiple sugar transport system substrate-binding protein